MRRRFKSTIEKPNPITIRQTEKPPASMDSHQPFDDSRNAKRVRFYDKGVDGLPDCAVATRRHETIQSPRSDVPKTSEYAYFRNIKNCKAPVRPGSLHKKDGRSKSSKAHYLNTESDNASDIHKPKNKDSEFSVSEERIRPNHHTLVSPRVNLTFKTNPRSPLPFQHFTPKGQNLPHLLLKEASEIPDSTCNTKQRSSLLSQNLTPERGKYSLNKALEISGNQCSKKGIFSEKRQRLLQWVIRTSSPDVQNIHPNGSDLVASLLTRLFPKSDESSGSLTEHSGNSKSLLAHTSKDLEKELKVPHSRNQDEHLPIIRYGISNEIVLSGGNIFESSFSSHKSGSENLIEYDIIDFDRLNSHESSSHKQFQFYHFKELEELCSPVEDAREEPHNRFLLDWDPERQKTGAYSSIVNRNSASLATSWHGDYQKMVDQEFDTKALCSSLEFSSMPNYKSPSYLIQDFEPVLEHVKYSVAGPDQFALTFPYNSNGVSLEDPRDAENTHFSIHDMISFRDDHWFKTKDWDGKVKNDLWQKFLYASDISEVAPSIGHTWRFPCAEQYFFSGNSFDNYFPSSSYHERYLDSLTNHTSLLSNFRKDRFEVDLYPDDDHKLEYDQVL